MQVLPHWIGERLRVYINEHPDILYDHVDLDADGELDPEEIGAIDLNNNGQIEAQERTGLSNTNLNTINIGSLRRFLDSNQTFLANISGFFALEQTWHQTSSMHNGALSLDNPILEILSNEYDDDSVERQIIDQAYQMVRSIYNATREQLVPHPGQAPHEFISPLERDRYIADLIRREMTRAGAVIGRNTRAFFSSAITDTFLGETDDQQFFTLDCDASSFLVLGIAHEFNIPLYVVQATSNHIALHYDYGLGFQALIDLGMGRNSDEDYIGHHESLEQARQRGYLVNLSHHGLLSLIYENRAITRVHNRQYEEAFLDARRAIELNPLNVNAFDVLSEVYIRQGDLAAAIETARAGLAVDPTNRNLYFRLGLILYYQGQYREAVGYINHGMYFNQNSSDSVMTTVVFTRAEANLRLGCYWAAIRDIRQCQEIGPNHHYDYILGQAYLGLARRAEGRHRRLLLERAEHYLTICINNALENLNSSPENTTAATTLLTNCYAVRIEVYEELARYYRGETRLTYLDAVYMDRTDRESLLNPEE